MTAHVDLGLVGQFEVGGRQAAVGIARVHYRKAGAQPVVQLEGHVGDAEQLEDAGLKDLAQALAGDALDDLSDPMDPCARIPALAGIELQGRHDGRARGGDHAGLALVLRKPVVGFAEEVVAEAAGMGQ